MGLNKTEIDLVEFMVHYKLYLQRKIRKEDILCMFSISAKNFRTIIEKYNLPKYQSFQRVIVNNDSDILRLTSVTLSRSTSSTTGGEMKSTKSEEVSCSTDTDTSLSNDVYKYFGEELKNIQGWLTS